MTDTLPDPAAIARRMTAGPPNAAHADVQMFPAYKAPVRTAVTGHFASGERATCWREPVPGPANRWWLGEPGDGIVRKPLPLAPEKVSPL